MRLFRNTFALLAVALLAAAPASAATITTADGNGADAMIAQRSDDDSSTITNVGENFGAIDRLGVRTWDGGAQQRFDAVLLRFDISNYVSGSFTGDSTLGLTLWRDNPNNTDVLIHGLNDGLDNWTEGDKDGATGTVGELTYNNAPGIEQDSVVGDNDLDRDSSETTALLATLANFTGSEGDEKTVASSDITNFLNADSDGLVTFLVLREFRDDTGQFDDFASKDATSLDSGDITGNAGDFAPSLTFDADLIPEPASVALLGLGGAVLLGRRRR